MLAALAARVEALERARVRLSRADRARLIRILPAAAGARGSELFLARDLAQSDDAGLSLVCRGLSAKTLGRLLLRASIAGRVSGYVVTAEGEESGATLWRIRREVS